MSQVGEKPLRLEQRNLKTRRRLRLADICWLYGGSVWRAPTFIGRAVPEMHRFGDCQRDVHGGGWVYGDKQTYQYYCMSLAEKGFAVVNFSSFGS